MEVLVENKTINHILELVDEVERIEKELSQCFAVLDLKALREENDLSQLDVVTYLNEKGYKIGQQHYSKIENGLKKPTLDCIKLILVILNEAVVGNQSYFDQYSKLNLKTFRKTNGLKQADVTDLLNSNGLTIWQPQYSRIENGKEEPSLDFIKAILTIVDQHT